MNDENERIPYVCGILGLVFVSGSILVLKFCIFLIFVDIGQGSISQNIDKIEQVRTLER